MSFDQNQNQFKAENLFSCKGLTAVVTGGGTGIGLMQTIALSQNGAKVFITSRNFEKLKDVAEKYGKNLNNNGGEIIPIKGDISNKNDIENLVKEIEIQSKDGINILFNNAGIAGEGSREGWENINYENPKEYSKQLLKSEFKEWDDILHTNVAGQYFTAAAFLPLLADGAKSTKGYASQIINVSSISGLMKSSSGGQFAYTSSKAALVHLSKVMAREFLPLRIRVNQIAPGIFPSEMTAGDSDSTTHKSDLSNTGKGKGLPSGRPGKEEDMAAATLYLASYAGVFVNGQFIAPDGGATVATPSSI
ncbi:uncharacterized protein I206_102260 [Kwoniella pini CBS 10737]|uniref:Short-chain dehydrogenase n=1 Tax=Kwoniella pini CBS 10737 TaxID=1296096 RepID=A0A1B9HSZ9_9TREE|nr:uncharacterized protein I206_07630 [Kwoniella pini CBS 10737]OCF46396.1 hypothetical protein I206_07630 [Kwoniella pini CBS 10737]